MGEFQDHFALFGLPGRFAVDIGDLERRYRDIQSRVHPDKHAHLGDADRRQAMQWATRTNEAYQVLKTPIARGRYMLELAGHDLQVEQNTAMPADFLVEQMERREAVADARSSGDIAVLEATRNDIGQDLTSQFRLLQELLDERGDYAAAADLLRRLMFQDKLLHEIDDALEAIEA